jgi:isopentenyl-diphosphate delta-isomerase
MKANVDLDVNVNEIRDVKYVTPEELKAMFADPSKFLCKKK